MDNITLQRRNKVEELTVFHFIYKHKTAIIIMAIPKMNDINL